MTDGYGYEMDEGRLLDALRDWAYGHPDKDRPFLALMEGRTFTPVEFLGEVIDGTEFGLSFLWFLQESRRRYDLDPVEVMRRAVDANRNPGA